jgi:hypothetical protein
MRSYIGILVACCIIAGCNKKEQSADPDSVLVKKYNEPLDTMHQPEVADKLAVDSLAIHRQQDEARLQRFAPTEVVAIYEAYGPLRNPKTTEAQIEAFLRQHKIRRDELRAVLAEGDRLGWAK